MSMTEGWITGILGFNSQNERYGLLVRDLWENDGFHCGAALQVLVSGVWTDTTMEMDGSQWYLVGTPFRGDDLEYQSARVMGWVED